MLLIRFLLWILKQKKPSQEARLLVMNHLIKGIGGLPIADVFTSDVDGTLMIRGKRVTVEQATLFQQAAEVLDDNVAYRLIKEQIAFEAIKFGIHSSLTFEMLMISKAAIWIQEQERNLIQTLKGR